MLEKLEEVGSFAVLSLNLDEVPRVREFEQAPMNRAPLGYRIPATRGQKTPLEGHLDG